MAQREIADEFDLEDLQYEYPRYEYTKLKPISGTDFINITSGGDESKFEIAARAVNLSKSYLSFDLNMVQPGGGNFNFLKLGSLPFRQVQLFTRSGVLLCDLLQADTMSAAIWPYITQFDEFKNNDQAHNTISAAGDTGRFSASPLLSPSRTIASNNLRLVQNTGSRSGAFKSDVAYDEMSYVVTGEANGFLNISVRIPLSMFSHTIFAMNKDLYVNEILEMKMIWKENQKFGFTSNNRTTPNFGNTTIYNDIVAITKLSLFPAYQADREKELQMKQAIDAGQDLNYLFDWVWSAKLNIPASTTQTITQRYNISNGQRLKRIYTVPMNNIENKNTLYQHANFNGTSTPVIVRNFHTELNNRRLQTYDVDPAQGEDYMIMRPMFKNSPILTQNIFSYNYLFIDSWEHNIKKEFKNAPDGNLIQGMPVLEEQQYMYTATTASLAINWYTFAVFQRRLKVNKLGLVVA